MQPRCVQVVLSVLEVARILVNISAVRTSPHRTSFHGSSTPMPYSFGKPGFGLLRRPLRRWGTSSGQSRRAPRQRRRERAPCETHPGASCEQRRCFVRTARVTAAAGFAAGAVAAVFAAAPPVDAAVVDLPARSGSGAAGGRGAGAGRACAVAAAAGAGAGAPSASEPRSCWPVGIRAWPSFIRSPCALRSPPAGLRAAVLQAEAFDEGRNELSFNAVEG